MIQSFNTTGIGSLPHTDPAEACRIILSSVDIPFWPQLPHRSFLELMVPQYLEGFPFVTVRGENIHVEKAGEEEIASFYEAIERSVGFPISQQYAEGLYAFIDLLKKKEHRLNAVKGHVTGPLTFTLSITDPEKRPIYFNEEMRELSLELLKGKVTWQINTLKPYAEEIILFIDEPILSALGTSAYLGVDAEEALRLLSELTRHIRDSGALSGIHCCSKGDWPLVLSAQPDIFNFDAYFFWDTLSLYPEALSEFISSGGFIAWGVVPTTDAIRNVSLDGLREQLERGISSLERTGISPDKLREQAILTPSCGTGSLEPDDAIRVFSLLKELRESYVNT
jgi:hypothetical protein